MATFDIIVGTVLGASEYVADALKEKLEAFNHQAKIHLEPDVAAMDAKHIWLVCTSTHGAGDLPDNIQPFADDLASQSLAGVRALVIGLGDSSYDTFCNGAIQMQQLLEEKGAQLLTEAKHIDVLTHPIPEDEAVAWLDDWLSNAAVD